MKALRKLASLLVRSPTLHLGGARPLAAEESETRARERNRRAAVTAASAVGGRGLTMLLSLLTVPLTLGYLGAERYGMWLTVASIIALLGFTDLGIGNGLLNALTKALARGDLAECRRQISSAVALLAALAIALGILFAILYPVVPWDRVLAVTSTQAASEAGPAVAMWLACFLLGLPASVVAQVRLARQEGYAVQIAAAAGNVAGVVALIAVIVSHQGVPWLVLAMAGPPLVASLANGVLLFRRHAPALRPSLEMVSRDTAIRLLRSGFLFLVLQLAMAVAFTTDTIVVAQLVGPAAVAEYGIAFRLFMIPAGFLAIALSPLWPAYGDAVARGDSRWARSMLMRTSRASLLVAASAAVILVVFGEAIIEAWVGGSVRPPVLLLIGLGIWIVQSSLGNAVAMLLNGAHEIQFQAVAAVVMAIANLTLSIWLTSQIGVAGVIWGTVITYAAFVLVPMAMYVPGVLRRIDVRQPEGSSGHWS